MLEWLFGKTKEQEAIETFKIAVSKSFREAYKQMDENPDKEVCQYCQQVLKMAFVAKQNWVQCPCGKVFNL